MRMQTSEAEAGTSADELAARQVKADQAKLAQHAAEEVVQVMCNTQS